VADAAAELPQAFALVLVDDPLGNWSQQPSAITSAGDPWVDDRIQQVDDWVAHHEHDRDGEDGALNQRGIAVEKRVEGGPGRARSGEQLFNDDDAAEQEPELEPNDGQHGRNALRNAWRSTMRRLEIPFIFARSM